ncbi:MAG: 23S rRNA (adenine(1618)-N(6))-methyltransferase RlmF [Chromatiaceae bacterium]|nr:23S rRNA (adenine(1618)-N(6))-methyltransferase RlmF [Chromatiaceae bacterium]
MAAQALLHPRNLHQGKYDFAALIKALPALAAYVLTKADGEQSIDFADNAAVVALNQALLAHYYQVKFWQLPTGYLCPPVPGRADYVHYLADLLTGNDNVVPCGKHITLVDIGTGANLIYPIIASSVYGWQVIGSDIDAVAVKAAQAIVASNPVLRSRVHVVRQQAAAIFTGVIPVGQFVHLTMCNPPFYASAAEANAANTRKRTNLANAPSAAPRNFAGQPHELWCDGGELAFISQMIHESQQFKQQVGWFSSLVSQKKHLTPLQALIKKVGAMQQRVIEMRQGQKISRILAWRFQSSE